MGYFKNFENDLRAKISNSIGDLGSAAVRSTLNALYPSEFELYLMSLELTNFRDEILDYFTFPINPNSITKNQNFVKDIDRGFGAIIVNKNGHFVPQDLTIKGNFGKEFKVLIRKSEVSFKGITRDNEMSKVLKNGYGCFKVLQNLCEQSDKMDYGRARRLYLHNFLLGESYLVEVLDFSGDMDMRSNMLWNYTLKIKIVAPINVKSDERVIQILTGQTQKILTSGVQSVKDLLRSSI